MRGIQKSRLRGWVGEEVEPLSNVRTTSKTESGNNARHFQHVIVRMVQVIGVDLPKDTSTFRAQNVCMRSHLAKVSLQMSLRTLR